MVDDLPLDVFRRIASFSASSRSLLDLWSLNDTAKSEISKEIASLTKNAPIRIDISRFFRENNPFQLEFCDMENEDPKKIHQKIRELARLLELLSEISTRFQIDNLTPAALGFQFQPPNDQFRPPFMLQKKLMHILARFEGPSISISSLFMRPSRQIRTFRHRFETITSLDLGTMKCLKSCQLRSTVFPALLNLDKLTWHHANHQILENLPNKNKMTSLDVTFHVVGRPDWREFQILTEFQNLRHFYCGFTVPPSPSRMHMDVLLNLYQSMWQFKFPNGRRLIKSFPHIVELGFWNSPEKVFKHLSLLQLQNLKTLKFGSASNKLCSFDSLLQSFFKFEELENALEPPKFDGLELNLHAMPAVGLDYYLPHLMDYVNNLQYLKRVSLLFKCAFCAEMTSTWSLEKDSEKRKRRILYSQYTHFQMHAEGLCGLEDLDRQLPVTLEVCSISLNLPAENAQKVLNSILIFIKKLGDLNSFPELAELHIQIFGIKCFELLVHTIHDALGPHLRKLSILAPPTNPEKSAAKALLRQFPEFFPKLENLTISIEILEILMKKEHKEGLMWREKVRKSGRKLGFPMSKWVFTTARALQNEHGEHLFGDFVPKGEEPAEYLEDYKEEKRKEKKEEEEEDDEMEDEEWFEEETMYESGPDELDILEQKLANESEKRHAKWEKEKKKRVKIEDSDEEAENKDPEEHDDDVIDWEQLDEMSDDEEEEEGIKRNDLFDDEAEEGEESEVEGEDEEEPEGEDLADSDDDRLFVSGPSRKRRHVEQTRNAKRRKIVISDDEEE